jgi:endonuclease/exonuclease/phosphatase family metal-dependent hydrolase
MDTAHFARTSRAVLGPHWSGVFATGNLWARVGLVYDPSRAQLRFSKTHPETIIGGRGQPALEGRFDVDGTALRVFVLHLECCDRSATRTAQLDALEPALAAARSSGDALVVVGDFNTVDTADRGRVRALASALQLTWATQAVACTHFWQRPREQGGDCKTGVLDQVLTSSPVRVELHGGCADQCGVDGAPRCPAWQREVSDHCPVVADPR